MSPSLPIDLDRSSGQPLYRQIERWIRHAIDGGRLPPGTRLPGVRTLARDLGVSVVPVITAYEQLGADGYLVSQVGLGTMVAPDPPRPDPAHDRARSTAPAPTAPLATGQRRARCRPPTAGCPDRPPRPTAGRASHRPTGAHPPPRPLVVAPPPPRPAADRGRRAEPARPRDDDLGLVWLRSMLAVRAGLRRADAPGADQLIVTAGVQAAIAAGRPDVARPRPDRAPSPATTRPPRAGARGDRGAAHRPRPRPTRAARLGPPRERIDLIVVAPAIAGLGGDAAGRRRLVDG